MGDRRSSEFYQNLLILGASCSIRTHGKDLFNLDINFRCEFHFAFLVAKVSKPNVPKLAEPGSQYYLYVQTLICTISWSTQRLTATRYYWPDMTKELNVWSVQCIQCQKSNIHQSTKSPVSQFPTTNAEF
uniref:Integrase zinc-binding domain-containing protein n=1 Tax=Glossina palpalis gambiensis TaxID=67801 RepID=A0A1B0BNR5_9MUSC